MSKYRLGIIFILILLATSITFAQSFFSSQPASQAATTTNPLTPPTPLAPSDFQNLVKQQTQKTQSQFNQQASQQINASPFQSPAVNRVPTPPIQPEVPAPSIQPDATTDNTESTSSNSATDAAQNTSSSTGGTSSGNPTTSTTTAPPKQNGLNIQY